jgi:type I pantothenate kinase
VTLPSVSDLAATLWARRPASGSFLIGLTGGVACGKTTLAATLADVFRIGPGARVVERIGTDGFLHTNAALAEKGLLDRKGVPDTYDHAAMASSLMRVRSGSVSFPGYSHDLYDIDPALSRVLDRPDVLVVEGLGLDARTPVDALVYLDANRTLQEAWYVARFLGFWERAADDPSSFYARFRNLDRHAVAELATRVWTQVNLPNLETHIEPLRALADIVVRKGADHIIQSIDAGVERRARHG